MTAVDKGLTVSAYIDALTEKFEKTDLYFGHGTDNAFDDAVYLSYGGLDLNFEDAEQIAGQVLSAADIAVLDELASRRIQQRIPVAYLVGTAWFGGYQFHCDSRALIPRSPIAELITTQYQPLLQNEPATVLDLCCGGGCIGIATALALPNAQVELVDISADAISLARDNIVRHGAEGRITAIESDLFSALTRRYDLIVCNPPYVSAQEIAELPTEYTHEPVLGLLSADDGLALPLKILRQAADFLTSRGTLIMEVGYSWNALAERLSDVPLMWLEFEHGGEGVFSLTASELEQYRERFI